MYQTQKLTRVGLSLAVLAAVLGLAIPQHAMATPVYAYVGGDISSNDANGNISANGADIYDAPGTSGSTTLTTDNWSYICPAAVCAGYAFSGGGTGRVDAGVLGAESHVSVYGTPPIGLLEGAFSYASFDDGLTITGGSGSGVLLLNWAVHGSLSNSNGINSSAGTLDMFDSNAPNGVYSSLNGRLLPPGSEPSFGGESGSPDGTANFLLPFTFGTPFYISPLLYADSVFYQAYNTTPYTAETDFLDTAALTSALVYDGTMSSNGPSGSLVDDAIIQSGDGFSYGPDGLSVPSTAVPEPGELPWFALGLGLLGLIIARRRFPYRRQFPR